MRQQIIQCIEYWCLCFIATSS